MPKLSELRTAAEIHAEDMQNPEYRAEHERTAFANAVAIEVLKYRTERGLSQTALARALGMHQPAIARLEAADHQPSLETLARISRVLGIEFHIDITPEAVRLRETA
ncbi:helix-turn-helix transcriptional regulator [Phytoactinopolyspora endophytica]|uniref:helix-turn-helix transcriptional regulator n=1 Tax=Phytoactinopolyspora endophytica TaxID=1642495 RepID=UPI00101B9E5C|nr:helix-turn-helix transcriptional regulator [Phytoactinopolyspora endophytica]